MKKIKKILFAISLMASAGAYAAPAWPGLISVTQSDGTVLHVHLLGDEHRHIMITTDSIPLVESAGTYYYASSVKNGLLQSNGVAAKDVSLRSATDRNLLKKIDSRSVVKEFMTNATPLTNHVPRHLMGHTDAPSIGEFHGLVILANFQDQKLDATHTATEINRMLNEKGYSDNGANGSVRDFYLSQSDNRFQPTFDVAGPVELSHEYAWYGSDVPSQDFHAADMIREACELAHEQGVDFSKYDNDGDGQVDMVYVIYAGYSQSNGASANTIWPHMYYLKESGNDITLDGVTIDTYATGGELSGTTGSNLMGIGLICHEFTHTLGIPDLYDTSTNYPAHIGIGVWDVMASGCYNNNAHTPAGYCSYVKEHLHWITPTLLDEPTTGFQITPLGNGGSALKIVNPKDSNEYFLLENRSKSVLYDSYLPGEGLLAIHVRYDSALFDNNTVNANDDNHLFIVPANGDTRASSEGSSITFPGTGAVTAFTALTTPSMTFHDGTVVNCPVTNINYDGTMVTLDYDQKPSTPVLREETNISSTGFRANWTAQSDARRYEIMIVNTLTGDSVTYGKIVRNRYTFSNLDVNATYLYKVRSEGELAYSDWSEPRTISLATDGITSVDADDHMTVEFYDMQGRKVNASYHGIVLEKKAGNVRKIFKR